MQYMYETHYRSFTGYNCTVRVSACIGLANGHLSQCCDQGTSPQDRGIRGRVETKADAVASEAKTEAVYPETKAARQLIGIGYSIPINIKCR